MTDVSQTPANVAINAMQAIPFSSMIGGPLKACIEAQAMAARTSWEFIKEVGLNTDEKGQKSAIMVAFSFNRGGRMVQLNVPLLTIVPIPYIAINTIDINFKASISASSSTASETSEHTEAGGEVNAKAKLNLGLFSLQANLKANYSSKKDSKATAESKYSVESTIDVAVKAGQESMPAGMAKVLELLGTALDVVDAMGELQVNATILSVGDNLVISYKNKEGLFDNSLLKIKKGDTLSLHQQCLNAAGSHFLNRLADEIIHLSVLQFQMPSRHNSLHRFFFWQFDIYNMFYTCSNYSCYRLFFSYPFYLSEIVIAYRLQPDICLPETGS